MELQYLVREPKNITTETSILFLLHGYGSNEEDLFSFRSTLPEDWLIISFRAPRTTGFGGYSWYDIDFMNPEKFINLPQATESLNAVLRSMMRIREKYQIKEGKNHICGFSQGGILSYSLALKNPQLFVKVACLSCYPEDKILQNIVRDKKKLEHLRFFISHGSEDAIIPLEWARKGADLLYDLGGYFTFREYMSGHGINEKNYVDLMQFMNS